jgi:hypothetical protein
VRRLDKNLGSTPKYTADGGRCAVDIGSVSSIPRLSVRLLERRSVGGEMETSDRRSSRRIELSELFDRRDLDFINGPALYCGDSRDDAGLERLAIRTGRIRALPLDVLISICCSRGGDS